MATSKQIKTMHAIERYSARNICRLPLDKERIQLDNNRRRSPYAIFALVFFGSMRQLARLEQRWYVCFFLTTEASNIDNKYDEKDPFYIDHYYLMPPREQQLYNQALLWSLTSWWGAIRERAMKFWQPDSMSLSNRRFGHPDKRFLGANVGKIVVL